MNRIFGSGMGWLCAICGTTVSLPGGCDATTEEHYDSAVDLGMVPLAGLDLKLMCQDCAEEDATLEAKFAE
jgi:hypothetical protein